MKLLKFCSIQHQHKLVKKCLAHKAILAVAFKKLKCFQLCSLHKWVWFCLPRSDIRPFSHFGSDMGLIMAPKVGYLRFYTLLNAGGYENLNLKTFYIFKIYKGNSKSKITWPLVSWFLVIKFTLSLFYYILNYKMVKLLFKFKTTRKGLI